MTDQQYPITPSPELVQQWLSEQYGVATAPGEATLHIATQAARWGADQELEACVEWLQDPDLNVDTGKLREARRPKPPSLRDQALAQTDAILNDPSRVLLTEVRETLELNRRALERLQELENND